MKLNFSKILCSAFLFFKRPQHYISTTHVKNGCIQNILLIFYTEEIILPQIVNILYPNRSLKKTKWTLVLKTTYIYFGW